MKIAARHKKLLLVALPLILAIVLFISYEFQHTSTNQYCGTACHIMRSAYEDSFHSIHREDMRVNCRDCHIPETSLPEALVYKAYSGARDYYKNTFAPPDVLMVKDWSQRIIQGNCIRCHQAAVAKINTSDGKMCFDCHRGIPHGQHPESFSTGRIYTPVRRNTP